MSVENPSSGISYSNIRINSIASSSGIFAGCNIQYLWCSDRNTRSGFGKVIGECNSLEGPCSVTTDSGSSSELLECLEKLVCERIGK